MTVEEAVQKTAEFFDEFAERTLADAEALLRHHGADAEELRLELERLSAEIADARRSALQHVRAYAETGQWEIN